MSRDPNESKAERKARRKAAKLAAEVSAPSPSPAAEEEEEPQPVPKKSKKAHVTFADDEPVPVEDDEAERKRLKKERKHAKRAAAAAAAAEAEAEAVVPMEVEVDAGPSERKKDKKRKRDEPEQEAAPVTEEPPKSKKKKEKSRAVVVEPEREEAEPTPRAPSPSSSSDEATPAPAISSKKAGKARQLDSPVPASPVVAAKAKAPPKPAAPLDFDSMTPDEVLAALSNPQTRIGSSKTTTLVGTSAPNVRKPPPAAKKAAVAKGGKAKDKKGGIATDADESVVHTIATKWMAAKELKEYAAENDVQLKSGAWLPVEDLALTAALDAFRTTNNFSSSFMTELIMTSRTHPSPSSDPLITRTLITELWTSLALSVPLRPIQAVYAHLRRIHDPLRSLGRWQDGAATWRKDADEATKAETIARRSKLPPIPQKHRANFVIAVASATPRPKSIDDVPWSDLTTLEPVLAGRTERRLKGEFIKYLEEAEQDGGKTSFADQLAWLEDRYPVKDRALMSKGAAKFVAKRNREAQLVAGPVVAAAAEAVKAKAQPETPGKYKSAETIDSSDDEE
ncbi:hypothetical protein RQP46_001868 [Phenoliferia psychrophenolica]